MGGCCSGSVAPLPPAGKLQKPIQLGTFPGTTARKPIEAFDETYLRRKRECVEKFFTSKKSGRKYCYWTDGAADPTQAGVPIVLTLHGMHERSYSWLLKEPLQNIFQISVDRVGHGLSSNAPKEGFSFADGCGELLELVDAVYAEWGIPMEKKFFVAGHSMGATWTIELAACPETRDRIEAIAPISPPADLNHPRVTESDKAAIKNAKNYEGVDGTLLTSSGCAPSMFRWFFRTVMFAPRASVKKTGEKFYGQDYGFSERYALIIKYAAPSTLGDAKVIDALEADPYNLIKFLDNFVSLNGDADALTEFIRCWSYPWSYDPGEVTVPCFLYCGKTESMGEEYQKLNKKLIGDNAEIIAPEGVGHATVALYYRQILEALVKKEKVSI